MNITKTTPEKMTIWLNELHFLFEYIQKKKLLRCGKLCLINLPPKENAIERTVNVVVVRPYDQFILSLSHQ